MHPGSLQADFEREGWVLVRKLVGPRTLEALVSATLKLERSAERFERDTLVRGVYFEVQSTSGRKGELAVRPGALRKITSPSKGESAFAKLRRQPEILAVLEQCGLHKPRCLIDQVNFKLERVGSLFPYHQDESFLFGEALKRVERFGGMNLVIALDPADESNGGFEVLGGTHTLGLRDVTYDMSVMNAGGFDESRRVVPTLLPGDAILFHPRLAHGSGRNPSDKPRRIVTLWFGGGA